ncbi:unnamed protein product [Schistosoma margrebowiei]|uniref:Kinesin-like protein n=1 Tax=Schistosoma margrebowiei TaxID=48269 RepID=A0A183LD81_9TREM|nr:unnamed protein product [Schistosoma margrebowiei]
MEDISSATNPDQNSDVICSSDSFISTEISIKCQNEVLNGSKFDYSPNGAASDVICPHNGFIFKGIAHFPEAVREPVWPDMKYAQAGNSDRVQGYLNDHETNVYFPFDCFAGESSLHESDVLISRINAYLSENWNNGLAYSNVRSKRNMYHSFVEALNNLQCLIQIPKPGVVHVFEPNVKNNNVREFQFDHTFWSLNDGSSLVPHASQEFVYQTLGLPLLLRALDGYNACLFAYGMTSSGKTYSFIVSNLLKLLEVPFLQCSSSLEIGSFGRSERDWIPFGIRYLVVREHPVTGPYIDGLLCEEVWSESDIIKRLDFGNRLRAVAATPLNENSSRSHTVLVLSLTKRSTVSFINVSTITKYLLGDIDNVYNSHITIVDLAGSERQTSTSTLSGRFIESCQINKSLFTLGKVITQLSQNIAYKKKAFPSPEPHSVVQDTCPLLSVTPCRLVNKRRDFVSYRDSLLTWLLKDSLGGNAVTVMLATVSPCQTHYDETLSTLRYAKKASSIVNSAMVNEDPKSRLIRELMSELRILRQKASSIMFESGTCQAYEAAKLRELISIREDGVLQLRRKLTDRRSSTGHRSIRAVTSELCKSTQTSDVYQNEADTGSRTLRRALSTLNCTNTIPLRFHGDKVNFEDIEKPYVQTALPSSSEVSTSVGHSLLCSPMTHCQLVDQIANLNCTLQSVQESTKKSEKLKVEAFDKLNREYQAILQLFPHLLKKVAHMTLPDNELGDKTSHLVSSHWNSLGGYYP